MGRRARVDRTPEEKWQVVQEGIESGNVSETCFQHQSTLRFMEEVLGLTSFPGAAANAPSMREFLSGNL